MCPGLPTGHTRDARLARPWTTVRARGAAPECGAPLVPRGASAGDPHPVKAASLPRVGEGDGASAIVPTATLLRAARGDPPARPSAHRAPHVTFLSRAAPVPERMASSKACRASAGSLGPRAGAEGVWETGGGWGGRQAGGRAPRSPSARRSGPRADSSASRKLRSSSEAKEDT